MSDVAFFVVLGTAFGISVMILGTWLFVSSRRERRRSRKPKSGVVYYKEEPAE